MAELEIYRTIRPVLVMQARKLRVSMRLVNRMGYTEKFMELRGEWVLCQDAMVALRRMLYGG